MTQTHHHTKEDPWKLRFWMFLAGLAAGALIVGVVWGVQSMYGSGDESSTDGSARPRSAGQSADQESTPKTENKTENKTQNTVTRREECRDLLQSQARLLRTGERPLAQWEVHIGAMNQLVAGAISVEQARAFWDETRVGAQRNLARYESARQRLEPAERGCRPRAGHVHHGQGVGKCRAAVTARTRAVQALDTTLATWREHVRHMEMLRTGRMSAEHAGQLWLASWETGNQQVRDYHAALRASRHARC
jgi:hypothetical protein